MIVQDLHKKNITQDLFFLFELKKVSWKLFSGDEFQVLIIRTCSMIWKFWTNRKTFIHRGSQVPQYHRVFPDEQNQMFKNKFSSDCPSKRLKWMTLTSFERVHTGTILKDSSNSWCALYWTSGQTCSCLSKVRMFLKMNNWGFELSL